MNLTISRTQLADALKIAARTGKGNVLPILQNIALRASGKHLEITSTDLDIYIRHYTPTEVLKSGEITVPAQRFSAIINALTGDDVELELLDKTKLQIISTGSQFKLLGLAMEEFPPFPDFKPQRAVGVSPTTGESETQSRQDAGGTLQSAVGVSPTEGVTGNPGRQDAGGTLLFRLDQSQLRQMLAMTSFAASTDESRFILMGNFFAAEKGRLTTAATDGRRLAAISHALKPELSGLDFQSVIPAKTVRELLRLLGEEGEVEITVSSSAIRFAVFPAEEEGQAKKPATILHSKLIEGTYPNYRQVIPEYADGKPTVKINRSDLLNSLTHVAIISDDEKCSLHFDEAVLHLSGRGASGEVKERIHLPPHPALQIILNHKYTIEGLRAFDDVDACLHYADSTSCMVIKAPDLDWVYIIMPMSAGAAPATPAKPEEGKSVQ